ncbi:MAG TPA: hypothetical protein VK992_02795 [Candidatus Caenarcaniphilales bacterium]|nr:hypothetical protein [Candidatus Caenarcaniphilales bacterium]
MHLASSRPVFQLGRLLILVVAAAVAAPAPAVDAKAAGTTVVEGTVAVEHGDDFAHKRSVHYRVLQTATDRLTLEGRGAAGLPDGAKVKLRGNRVGNRFVLADTDSVVAMSTSDTTRTTSTTSSTTVTRSKRLAVIVVNFQSDLRQPWTLSGVQNVLFDGASSARAYWSEVSNGSFAVSGDVFGYYTLSNSTSQCDYSTWMSAGKSAASASGVDLSGYTNYMLVFPRQSACGWGGLGSLPGTNTWINGSLTTFVVIHELGHNFGAHHASTLNCRNASGARVSFSDDCTRDEYGDPFDVMGNNTRHGNSWHRRQWGLLSSFDEKTVTSSGRYTVAVAEVGGGTPRIVRVARPVGNYFYVEYRQPYGTFDAFSSTSAAVHGVMVRLAPDTSRVQSKLIDTTPDTTTFSDAPLALDRTFIDVSSGISITTVALTSTAATLEVRFGTDTAPPADTTAPSAPGNLLAGGTGPLSVGLSWTAATDNIGVSGYKVRRDGTLIATLGPSATSYTEANLTSGASYTYSVAAFDAAGNNGPAASVGYKVPIVDTEAPTVPENLTGGSVKRKLVLSWTASTDNSGSVAYRVFRDGQLVATLSATSYTESGKSGTYTYSIRAVDPAGNHSASSNEVTLLRGR